VKIPDERLWYCDRTEKQESSKLLQIPVSTSFEESNGMLGQIILS
jgi:hypothetical protein